MEGVRIALLAVASACAAGVTLLALAHVDDRYELDHVAGAWMALAQRLADGTLYPPLYDGEQFGGTRFAPLAISLHGGAARLTGETIVSGKLVSAVAFAAVLALVWAHLRRAELGRPESIALLASLLVAPVGLLAALGIRGDAPALALGLGALLCALRAAGRAASCWPASSPARLRWRRSMRSSPWRRSRSGC